MAYDLTDYIPMADRPEDYVPLAEFSDSMKLALISLLKDDKIAPEEVPYITEKMQEVITYLANDSPLKYACELVEITNMQHTIWLRTNKLYAKAIALIKDAQSEALEDVVWQNALSGTSQTSIERMFALKSRKEEYKENSVIADTGNISIRVTLDGGSIPKSIDAEFTESGEDIDNG